MIRDAKLDGFEMKEWDEFSSTDRKAMTWIWNQLMGETTKGDTLEFMTINRGDERVYAGLLRDGKGAMKGLVPAMYEREHEGFLETVNYKGLIRRDDQDNLDAELEIRPVDVDVEDLARDFLSSKGKLTIILDLARFLCDYSSDDLRVQSSGDMSGSFLQ